MHKLLLLLLETNVTLKAVSTYDKGIYFVQNEQKGMHLNTGNYHSCFYINDFYEELGEFAEWEPQSITSIYDIHMFSIYENNPYTIINYALQSGS